MIYGGIYYGQYFPGTSAPTPEPCITYTPEQSYEFSYDTEFEVVCALHNGVYRHNGSLVYHCVTGVEPNLDFCDPSATVFTQETPLKVCV